MINLTVERESDLAVLLKINAVGSQNELAEELNEIEFPDLVGAKGLILSGFPQFVAVRCALHYKNLVRWVGIVDPKLRPENSAVIVSSIGDRSYRVGDVVPLSISDSGSLVSGAAK